MRKSNTVVVLEKQQNRLFIRNLEDKDIFSRLQ